MMKYIVVGISGPTNSGKSLLAQKLNQTLKNSVMINQDDYFLPIDDPRHKLIPELNHFNWEILSSLDMEKMHSDILDVLQKIKNEKSEENSKTEKVKFVIIEGFLIFNYKPIADLCDLKYFLLISKEVCWNRRKERSYDPPDVPGYFDKVVWPEYLRHKAEMMSNSNLSKTLTFLDGTKDCETLKEIVINGIECLHKN